MDVGNRGYVFTLITAVMILTTLSLLIFYTEVASPSYADASNKMSLDELHYFVESLREDASRAISISGQRSATFLIDHIILTNETFAGYRYDNCTTFNYTTRGVEAALAELMVCGTLDNTAKPTRRLDEFMGGNTIGDWMDRVKENQTGGLPYTVDVELMNFTMAQYDPWHFVVVSRFDFVVNDTTSQNTYTGYEDIVTSVVEINSMEDPTYHVKFGVPKTIPRFSECDIVLDITGPVLDDRIDEGCYVAVPNHYRAPSFFDRLEGNDYLSNRFIEQSFEVMSDLGHVPDDIAFASLINLNLLREHDIEVNGNLSQVDYMYWNEFETTCRVDEMSRHAGFRLDTKHAQLWEITTLNCMVDVRNEGSDAFDPVLMAVPLNTTITFLEKSGLPHTLYETHDLWGEATLRPGGTFSWKFKDSGGYTVTCTDPDHTSGDFELSVVE